MEFTSVVTSLSALESAVGERPAGSMLKSIPVLDEHCRALLARSPFVVLGSFDGAGAARTVTRGGPAGLFTAADDTTLTLGAALAADGTPFADIADGAPAGLIALVPGYGETLRINGRVRLGNSPTLEVEEAFLHCAKAIIRSELWGESTADSADHSDAASFLASAPFALLSTIDAAGGADVSPKGDPAGLIRFLDESTIVLADRPGNRRTDTLHNLMDNSAIGLVALVPGDPRIAEVRGRARVATDESLLASLELRGKVPKAAVVIDVDHLELRDESSVTAAELWDRSLHVDKGELPRGARIWTDHVAYNTKGSLKSKALSSSASEKLFAKALERDYRDNL